MQIVLIQKTPFSESMQNGVTQVKKTQKGKETNRKMTIWVKLKMARDGFRGFNPPNWVHFFYIFHLLWFLLLHYGHFFLQPLKTKLNFISIKMANSKFQNKNGRVDSHTNKFILNSQYKTKEIELGRRRKHWKLESNGQGG